MEFDFNWNGIIFLMSIDTDKDADESHWSDVDFAGDNGDIEHQESILTTDSDNCVTVKRVTRNTGYLMVEVLTTQAQEEIRKLAYQDLCDRNEPQEP